MALDERLQLSEGGFAIHRRAECRGRGTGKLSLRVGERRVERIEPCARACRLPLIPACTDACQFALRPPAENESDTQEGGAGQCPTAL